MSDEDNVQEDGGIARDQKPQAKVVKVNYGGNSHKAKAKAEKEGAEGERPKVEKVIVNEAIQRKKPLGRKISEMFSGENMHDVGNFVLMDIIIPGVKGILFDSFTQGLERRLFGGESGGYYHRRSTGSGLSGSSKTGFTNYNGISKDERPLSRRARATHDFREIVLKTQPEAKDVLERLGDMLDQFGQASVSDLFDLVGVTGSYTDDKWGWTDLRGAGIRRVREGYLLDLPPTHPLD